MAKSVKDILALIEKEGIKMVDFKMVDINGQYRHVTIPAENFSEDTMKSGIGFDASNYGYAVVEKSDMVFIPDPDTAVIDPFWLPGNTSKLYALNKYAPVLFRLVKLLNTLLGGVSTAVAILLGDLKYLAEILVAWFGT